MLADFVGPTPSHWILTGLHCNLDAEVLSPGKNGQFQVFPEAHLWTIKEFQCKKCKCLQCLDSSRVRWQLRRVFEELIFGLRCLSPKIGVCILYHCCFSGLVLLISQEVGGMEQKEGGSFWQDSSYLIFSKTLSLILPSCSHGSVVNVAACSLHY